MADLKRCYACKNIKELPEFNKRKRSDDGYDSLCRECASEQHRQEYLRHKSKIIEKAHKYYINNKSASNQRSREYYKKTQPQKAVNKCKCGCGETTNPGREYINGHHNRGRTWPREVIEKMSKGRLLAVTDAQRQAMSVRMKGRIVSEEEKINREKTRPRGDKHHAWLGGISKEEYGYGWNKALKETVYNRDLGKCQNPRCSGKSKKINVHHIDYNKRNHDINNLITLCTSCHCATNFNRDDWNKYYAKIIDCINARQKEGVAVSG
jgi:hypothetical protein